MVAVAPPSSSSMSSSGLKVTPVPSKAPTSPRRAKRSPAGGPGKKGKIFSENLGLSHLVSLASTAGMTEEERNAERAGRNRESAQWKKKKRMEKASKGGKSDKSNSTTGTDGSSSATARTKAVIRADLKAKLREKTKVRKEKRRSVAAEVKAYDSDDEETKARKVAAQSVGSLKAQPAKKYKSVTFA